MSSVPARVFPASHFLLLAILFLAWQLPGTLGRDPWKSDEAYTVGLVHHMIETGDWVVPQLGGEPFMQKPPVFFVTAAAIAKALAPVLPEHVGMRGATLLFNLLTMIFLGLASRELNGRGRGWPAAVMFLACIGPLHMAHFVLTDLAMLAGIAASLWGMSLGLRRAWLGGFVCGAGAALAFMAKGLLGAGLPGATVLTLLMSKEWRGHRWLKFTAGCITVGLPLSLVWPGILFFRSPELFNEWFVDNNFGRFNVASANLMTGWVEAAARHFGLIGADVHLAYHDVNGPKAAPGYMFVLLPWYAFPASVFAAWSLWRAREKLREDASLQVPLTFFAICLVVFTLSRDGREIYALPVVAPLLLLGARCLDDLSASAVRRIDRATFISFSALAFVMWLAWLAVISGRPSWVLDRIHRQVSLESFESRFEWWPFIGGVALTLGWGGLLLAHRPEGRRIPAHLAAGVALVYGLAMTIFLPLAEAHMSYEPQFGPLREVLPPSDVVVSSRGLGEPQRAMLHYYAGLKTKRVSARREVKGDWLLLQTSEDPVTGRLDQKNMPGEGWDMIWEARHDREVFQMFRRHRSEPSS